MKIKQDGDHLIILSDDERVRLTVWVDDASFTVVAKSERVGTDLSVRSEQSDFSYRIDGKVLDRHPNL